MESPSVEALLARASSSGEAWQANQLIHDARAEWEARHGQAANYEIVVTGRSFDYLEREVAPRLAFYLRSKRYSVEHCAPVFLSIFCGDRLYFLGAQNFFEYLREARGYSQGGFAALVSVWERTGQGAVGLLAGGGSDE